MSRVSRNADSVICLSVLSSASAEEQYTVQKLKKAMERRLSILSANAWVQGRGFIASAGLGDSARAPAHLYTKD
jgi:hypothetical protein